MNGAEYLQNLTDTGESPTFFGSIPSKKTMARGSDSGSQRSRVEVGNVHAQDPRFA